MIVKVRYLSYLVDIVNVLEEEYKIDREEITIRELLDIIKSRHPKLKGIRFGEDIRGEVNVIKNGRYANFDEGIRDGDVIIIFPPIVGG